MKIMDLLTEAYDTSKARIEHPEDLVLSNGAAGAAMALAMLNQAATNPTTVSVKPDGRPAIKWGRDQGGFAMGDKYMNPLPHSIEELTSILSSRKGGGREDLVAMYTALWPIFENSVPSIHGYLFGDLMYSSRPAMSGGVYHLKPNTVDYTVPANGNLGSRIGQSTAGIVVHTYLPMDSTVGQHIEDIGKISGIRPIGDLLMISDKLHVTGRLKLPNMSKVTSAVQQYSGDLNAFLDPGALAAKKIVGMTQLLKKYVNQRVKTRNFDDMANGFLEWVQSNTNQNMAASIGKQVQEHQVGYKAMWLLFQSIAATKNAIVAQLDQTQGEMSASVKGEHGHEGYVVHSSQGPVKLVNRFKFSAANFEQ